MALKREVMVDTPWVFVCANTEYWKEGLLDELLKAEYDWDASKEGHAEQAKKLLSGLLGQSVFARLFDVPGHISPCSC